MDIVERLRHADRKCGDEHPDIELDWEAADEIERLRQQNAELVEAMTWIVEHDRNANPLRTANVHKADCKCWRCAIDNAEAVLAKATGGE